MEPIKFNYPPDVAAKFVDEMTESAKNDPKASEKERAVFEDIQTMVHFAKSQLIPLEATSPAEPVNNHKS
jgi:hypothetical protein